MLGECGFRFGNLKIQDTKYKSVLLYAGINNKETVLIW